MEGLIINIKFKSKDLKQSAAAKEILLSSDEQPAQRKKKTQTQFSFKTVISICTSYDHVNFYAHLLRHFGLRNATLCTKGIKETWTTQG